MLTKLSKMVMILGLISVVVPCLSGTRSFYYEICKIAGYARFELIFADDVSMDDTLSTVKPLIKEDEQVRCISFYKNFDKKVATFVGLEKSKGNYISIIDVVFQVSSEFLVA